MPADLKLINNHFHMKRGIKRSLKNSPVSSVYRRSEIASHILIKLLYLLLHDNKTCNLNENASNGRGDRCIKAKKYTSRVAINLRRSALGGNCIISIWYTWRRWNRCLKKLKLIYHCCVNFLKARGMDIGMLGVLNESNYVRSLFCLFTF